MTTTGLCLTVGHAARLFDVAPDVAGTALNELGHASILARLQVDAIREDLEASPGLRTIAAALAADDPFDGLPSIGASQYGLRIATLRAGIKDLEIRDKAGRKVYNRDAGDFVVPSGG